MLHRSCRGPLHKAPHLIGFPLPNHHVGWTRWQLNMYLIGTSGKAFDYKVQEPRKIDTHRPTDTAQRHALMQQVLNQRALLIRDEALIGTDHQLASACRHC